jgi:hypothetical protein
VKCRLEIGEIAGGMETDGKDLRVEARVMTGRESDRVEMLPKILRLEIGRSFVLLELRRFLIADAPFRIVTKGVELGSSFGARGAAVGFGL